MISVLEFGDWIIKRIRGHYLSADLKKVKNKCCMCCQQRLVTPDTKELLVQGESETSPV